MNANTKLMARVTRICHTALIFHCHGIFGVREMHAHRYYDAHTHYHSHTHANLNAVKVFLQPPHDCVLLKVPHNHV